MTLEEAIAWCIEHNATLRFYRNERAEKRVEIGFKHSTAGNISSDEYEDVIEAVINAELTSSFHTVLLIPGD